MPVRAILFDADGVLQKPSAEFWTALSAVVGDERRDALLEDVFAAELPALTGAVDFAEQLAPVLSKWGRDSAVQQTINAWTHIDVDAAQIDLIGSLRAARSVPSCRPDGTESSRVREREHVRDRGGMPSPSFADTVAFAFTYQYMRGKRLHAPERLP